MTGTETPFMNHLTHSFTPQPTPADVCVDGQLRAVRRPEMGSQNGGDACYASTSGMNAELARGAASESSALVAHVDGSRATLGMQVIRDSDSELASFCPSPLMLELTVVTTSPGASLRRAAIRYNSASQWDTRSDSSGRI